MRAERPEPTATDRAREAASESVFNGFLQLLVLIDLPNVVNPVTVEIDDSGGRGPETVFRGFDDLDQVIRMTAVRDELLLFEAQLFERGRITRIGVEIAPLKRVQERQLLLGFGSLGTRNERHQVRKRDKHQNADDNQHDQQLRQRKGIQHFVTHGKL